MINMGMPVLRWGPMAAVSAGNADFGDIFGDVFGDIFGAGGRRQQRATRGADLRYNMELSLEEAVRGVNKEIKVPTLVGCDECHGSGAKAGSQPQTCPTLSWQWPVQMRQGSCCQPGLPCCRGKGKIIMIHAVNAMVKVATREDQDPECEDPGGSGYRGSIRSGRKGVCEAGAPAGDLLCAGSCQRTPDLRA